VAARRGDPDAAGTAVPTHAEVDADRAREAELPDPRRVGGGSQARRDRSGRRVAGVRFGFAARAPRRPAPSDAARTRRGARCSREVGGGPRGRRRSQGLLRRRRRGVGKGRRRCGVRSRLGGRLVSGLGRSGSRWRAASHGASSRLRHGHGLGLRDRRLRDRRAGAPRAPSTAPRGPPRSRPALVPASPPGAS